MSQERDHRRKKKTKKPKITQNNPKPKTIQFSNPQNHKPQPLTTIHNHQPQQSSRLSLSFSLFSSLSTATAYASQLRMGMVFFIYFLYRPSEPFVCVFVFRCFCRSPLPLPPPPPFPSSFFSPLFPVRFVRSSFLFVVRKVRKPLNFILFFFFFFFHHTKKKKSKETWLPILLMQVCLFFTHPVPIPHSLTTPLLLLLQSGRC